MLVTVLIYCCATSSSIGWAQQAARKKPILPPIRLPTFSPGLELRTLLPLGFAISLRHVVPDTEQKLEVLHRSGKLPVRPHGVGGFMVVMLGVVVDDPATVSCGPADEIHATLYVERGYARLSELEMVGTEKVSAFWNLIGNDRATLEPRERREYVLEIGIAVPDHFHVLGAPVHVHPVHVDVCHRQCKRHQRVGRVVLRAQQATLFGRRGDE